MAVEDIKRVQEVIARESKQLVYTHYNLVVAVSGDTDIQKCTNHLENSFSRMGIHISKRALLTYRDTGVIPYTAIGGIFLYPESGIRKVLEGNYYKPIHKNSKQN